MTLTPEQFNLLATSDELADTKKEVKEIKKEMKEGFGKIMDVLDVLVKDKKDQEVENIANTEAHSRINRDLLKIKEQAKIGGMEVVEQV